MRLRFIATASLLMFAGYGVVWYYEASAVKTHVETSLLHLRQAFKKTNSNVRIQWDDISLSGFPFSPSASVTSPTLSMVYHDASYSVGFDSLTFTPSSFAGTLREGVYKVAPKTNDMRALYAEAGNAPEKYHVEWDMPVPLKLLAYNPERKPQRCVMGERCLTKPDTNYPLSYMRVSLPPKLLLLAGYHNEYKPIQFRFNELQRAAVALDYPIPADVTYPLQLFVGMLREAHIYQ